MTDKSKRKVLNRSRDCGMKGVLILTLCGFLTVLGESNAQPKTNSDQPVVGDGLRVCKDVIGPPGDSPETKMVAQWVLGYLSAQNLERKRRDESLFDLKHPSTKLENMTRIIFDRCFFNQDKTVFEIMRDYYEALPKVK